MDENTHTTEVSSSATTFKVVLKNSCSYPVRFLILVDETTGKGTYSVFQPFEKRELYINLLTLQRLQNDPKARLSRVP